MKKNVLITLFALILLSLMSCKTEAGLKENEIAVDTTQFELVPKNALEDSIALLKDFIVVQDSANTWIRNYIDFAKHDFNASPNLEDKFLHKVPPYHITTIRELSNIVNELKKKNPSEVGIAIVNQTPFNNSNPFNIDCKLIIFGFDSGGNVIPSSLTDPSIYFLNDMRRCPPDNNCTGLNLPVSYN